MKKLFLFLILALFLLSINVNADSTVNFPGNFLKITLLDQDPDPVKPGELFDLKLRVLAVRTDARDNKLNDLRIELIQDDIFTVDSSVRELGTLRESEIIDVIYRVKIDSKAADGVNRIKFRYSVDDGVWITSEGFLSIDTRSTENNLAVTSIMTEPETVYPGAKADLSLVLKNAATSSMRDISIKLNLAGTPFTPLETTAEKRIRILEPDEEVYALFNLIADVDAESKPYKIPLTISYLDDENNKFTKNDTIGLLIYSEPELDFNIEGTEVVSKGQSGEIVMSISNIGPSEVKFITVSLLEDESYDAISVDKAYLGNLDSDDFQTASFNVHVNKNNPNLKFRIDYKDAYNKDFSKEVLLPLKIYSNSKAASYGLVKSNGGVISLIFWILLIAFVLYGFKGWRHEKSLEKGLIYGLKKTIKLIINFILFFRWRNLKSIPSKIKKIMRE